MNTLRKKCLNCSPNRREWHWGEGRPFPGHLGLLGVQTRAIPSPVACLGQTQSGGVVCGFAAVLHVQLAQNIFDVGFNGILGNHQSIGDLGVGEALGHEPENLLLPDGQAGDFGSKSVGRWLDQAGAGGLSRIEEETERLRTVPVARMCPICPCSPGVQRDDHPITSRMPAA